MSLFLFLSGSARNFFLKIHIKSIKFFTVRRRKFAEMKAELDKQILDQFPQEPEKIKELALSILNSYSLFKQNAHVILKDISIQY